LSDAVVPLNREWRYTYLNGAAERLTRPPAWGDVGANNR